MRKKWTIKVRQICAFLVSMTILFIASLIYSPNVAAVGPHDLADFEAGYPAGWGPYSGGGASVTPNLQTIAVGSPSALPIQIGSNVAVSTTYNIPAGGWGGFSIPFATPQDWSNYDGLRFWFYGTNSGLSYQAEIFDNGGSATNAELFDYSFVDNSVGWRHIEIPFGAFTRATDFQPGGEPNDGLTLTQMWGWAIPLPVGNAQFYIDNIQLYADTSLADFEAGYPAGWGPYSGGGASVTPNLQTIAVGSSSALPIQIGSNVAVSTTYNIPAGGWGGFSIPFATPQDWSNYDGLRFWFYGTNSGLSYQAEIFDNGGSATSAELFDYSFVDNSVGWRHIEIPFGAFTRATDFQPGGEPNDGLTLTQMWGWAIPLPVGASQFYIDNVNLYPGPTTPTVSLAQTTYSVSEGGVVTITAQLNITSTGNVTVSYATANGTATSGADYTTSTGQLVFPSNTLTQSFTVATVNDSNAESSESFAVDITNPISAQLGTPSQATVTIADDDSTAVLSKADNVDDFESGPLFTGTDSNNIGIGFVTWQDSSSSVAIASTTNTAEGIPAVPDQSGPSNILKLDSNVASWGGFTHAFTDGTNWINMDWSDYTGINFWLYGTGSGTTLFVDIMDNRNPGATTDDAERWSYSFTDNVAGWHPVEIPFSSFTRKNINNGAPNDGLQLTQVWGWALGSLTTGGQEIRYVDDVGLMIYTDPFDDFETSLIPNGPDANGVTIGYVPWSGNGASSSIATTTAPPAVMPGMTMTNTVLQLDLNVSSGQWAGYTHAFADAAMSTWTPEDWSVYEGVCFWLYGNGTGGDLYLDILDNRNPNSTTDDAERWRVTIPDNFTGWKFFQFPFSSSGFTRQGFPGTAPNDGLTLTDVHGYAIGGDASNANIVNQSYYIDELRVYGDAPPIGGIQVAFANATVNVTEGNNATIDVTLNAPATAPVTVNYASMESTALVNRDYTAVSGQLTFAPGETIKSITLPTLDDIKVEQVERILMLLTNPISATFGFQQRMLVNILDNDTADPQMVTDIEGSQGYDTTGNVTLSVKEAQLGTTGALPVQGDYEGLLQVDYTANSGPNSFDFQFPATEDWSAYQGLSFWYQGSNSGQTVSVELQDNQAATTANVAPANWTLAWSDEFNDAAGTPPNLNVWTHELGDGALNELSGWGNDERQYYTDSTNNAATDGSGNMVITLNSENTATTSLVCWYGPCEYTSARLISAYKKEIEYGRVEARVQVPTGPDGLWPAFWMLGTDIDQVFWPQSGEIDIMEYVSRLPNEVFGTIHGPGYFGGASFGNTQPIVGGVAPTGYHDFVVEWSPNEIQWYVDGINYHSAIPSDVAPNQWVFNHPFYLIFNLAIGGNFGGAVDPAMTTPQTMIIDYVRVYQAPDTAERFTASFVDDFTGWQQIMLPFTDFARSANQPAGAPNDGLGLTAMTGYGFSLPTNASGSFCLDQVRLEATMPTNTTPTATPTPTATSVPPTPTFTPSPTSTPTSTPTPTPTPTPSAYISLSPATQVVAEGGGTISLNLILNKVVGVPVNVTLGSLVQLPDYATASLDYSLVNQTVVFQPGETQKQITVAINQDIIEEATEQFNVVIEQINGGGVVAVLSADTSLVIILDDDEATATPTITATATETATPTATDTATVTSTPTATNTPTATDTALPTSTPVPTATDVPTAIAMLTATSQPVATNTVTPIPSPTLVTINTPVPITEIPTATQIATATATATVIPPTVTAVPTVTSTNTDMPATSTATATTTALPTDTPVPPTATDVPPTSTAEPTTTPTSTDVPATAIATSTVTALPTDTPTPPTATDVPPTSTVEPTATPTSTDVSATATATVTALPTNTPVPPTATDVPPTSTAESTVTPTSTDVPVTATAAATATATALPTDTPVSPTVTPEVEPTATPLLPEGGVTLLIEEGDELNPDSEVSLIIRLNNIDIDSTIFTYATFKFDPPDWVFSSFLFQRSADGTLVFFDVPNGVQAASTHQSERTSCTAESTQCALAFNELDAEVKLDFIENGIKVETEILKDVEAGKTLNIGATLNDEDFNILSSNDSSLGQTEVDAALIVGVPLSEQGVDLEPIRLDAPTSSELEEEPVNRLFLPLIAR